MKTPLLLYNCDLPLWQSFKKRRETMPNGGCILLVLDGHISDGHQILARFKDNAHAERTLMAAGFTPQMDNQWK